MHTTYVLEVLAEDLLEPGPGAVVAAPAPNGDTQSGEFVGLGVRDGEVGPQLVASRLLGEPLVAVESFEHRTTQ